MQRYASCESVWHEQPLEDDDELPLPLSLPLPQPAAKVSARVPRMVRANERISMNNLLEVQVRR